MPPHTDPDAPAGDGTVHGGAEGAGWRITVRRAEHVNPSALDPADLIFADSPYNFGLSYALGDGGKGDRLPECHFLARLQVWLRRSSECVRPGGAVWWLLPDEWADDAGVFLKRTLALTRRGWVKWHETFGAQTKLKFARTSRHLLYHVAPGGPVTFEAAAVKVPSARQLKYKDRRAAAGGKVPGDVWQFPRVCGTFAERAEGFPTQLPEALLERVVRACTRPGDLVREFFTGSGSLARVCVRLGRRYDGYEASPRFAAMAAARVRAGDPVKAVAVDDV